MPPSVKQHLGVAAGREARPELDEFGAQLHEVVDLAVEDDGQIPLRRAHRLGAAAEVDDGEPPVAERQTRLEMHAFAVRTPVGDQLRHPADEGFVERPGPACVEQTR